ncbi:TMP1 [Blepharisma stoltei]|uniref:Flavoprotein domain-containing protein n=1 Tax=Blepharisma stoltei TaxID=1481888 RepID=A0AAU9JCP0_9CILI|nr:unnamed protein product [Blepharisma stoltei]
MDISGKNILVSASGSCAAANSIPVACELMTEENCVVKILLTKNAERFFFKDWNGCEVIRDDGSENFGEDTEYGPEKLYEWADALIIAPIGANTLAKIAIGMHDNLLTKVVQQFINGKPLILAPAMNPMMFSNPFTAEHINKIKTVYTNSYFVDTTTGIYGSGETGMGGLADSWDIVTACKSMMLSSKS